MLSVQLSQYLLKESQPALHTDGKRVYMLNDEGLFVFHTKDRK
ncbi:MULTISPECIES: hypothetical protein [Bacillus]|nr:hypothetical protein [Bacillus mycoides]